MKILVPVKRVVDYNIKVRVKPDNSEVDIAGAKMSMNPFDENALEEALRLKESGVAAEVVAISFGTPTNQDVLRQALAMGADRVTLVESGQALQPLGVAKLLQAVIATELPDLIIMGKQAIDDDNAQTGPMLAALLGYGQGTFISKLTSTDNTVTVTREIDGGTEALELDLPAVLTADLRLNEPRFVKLPNLMLARKKPITIINADDLGVDYAPRLKLLQVNEPAARKPGIKVGSVQELLQKLRQLEGMHL